QNKNKSAMIEDEPLSSINSNVESTYKKAGFKQVLVNCLASEAKKKCKLGGLDNSEKEKGVEPDKNSKPALNNSNKFLMGLMKKNDLSKARNQCKCNEWCMDKLLLDKALLYNEIEYMYLARQMALEGAYMVRVVDRMDEQFFENKLSRAYYELNQAVNTSTTLATKLVQGMFSLPVMFKEYWNKFKLQESFVKRVYYNLVIDNKMAEKAVQEGSPVKWQRHCLEELECIHGERSRYFSALVEFAIKVNHTPLPVATPIVTVFLAWLEMSEGFLSQLGVWLRFQGS
ncbi:43949_t:CDS:2, partial [Gigaspora margarita]